MGWTKNNPVLGIQILEMDPIKTKIEERLERAVSGKSPTADKYLSLSIAKYENSSILEANSERKLLNQFRDCVKFLLDWQAILL